MFPDPKTFEPLRDLIQLRDHYTLRVRDEARRLASLGIPETVIARQTGLSRTTIRRAAGKG